MLKIKSVRFKNFLSYGEQEQGYSFSKGLTSISAPSGYGKSVLLEALAYSLYGQPYRDIKLDDLVNRTNQSGMSASCEFEANGSEYKVVRGRKPDVFRIEKNGAAMDKASSSSLTQEALNRIIGIDFDMFRRVLCISTVNNSPFLDSSKESKRKAKDQLFNLEVLGQMLKKAKEEATRINTKVAVAEKALDVAENEWQKAKLALDEHCERVKSYEADKKNRVIGMEKQMKESIGSIQSYSEELEKAKAKRERIAKKTDELGIEAAMKEESGLKAKSMNLKERLNELKEFVKRGEGVCEACGQKIGPECVERARKEMESGKKAMDAAEAKLEAIEARKEIYKEGTNLLKELDKRMLEIANSMESEKKSVAAMRKAIETEKKREYPDSESAKKRMKEAEDSLTQARAGSESAGKSKAVNKDVQKVLGDDGVRKVIVSAILPMFNSMVAVNCQRFGLPMTVEFDEKMEEIVKECRSEYPYKGCSEGEKARLNMAIQMAMLEISRAVSGWDCNLIVLDEILDNSLDVESILKIVGYLREKCDSGDKNVIVISHKLAGNPSSIFDKTFKISKQLGFSLISRQSED